MDNFSDWFVSKMHTIDFEPESAIGSDVDFTVIKMWNKKSTDRFDVIYIKRPIPIEALKILFTSEPSPLLIVVDSDLVTEWSVNNSWLRAIHALYYGRIYVWDGRGIGAVHFDQQTLQMSSAESYIDVSVLSFEKVDCWYKNFPGIFYIARFDDKPFWKKSADPRYAKKEPPPKRDKKPNENEQFWRNEYEAAWERVKSTPYDTEPRADRQRAEDVFRDFKEAFERNKRQYQANNEPHYPPGRYVPTGDKWLTMLLAEKTLEGAKKKYRQLALENHPDRLGDSPEVIATMQLINAAWARAKEILV